MVHPNDIQGALVYTNDRGEVVFVNRHFLRMMNYSTDNDLMGQPMDAVLQLGVGITAELESQVRSNQMDAEMLLHLYSGGSDPYYVLCSSSGAFDDAGKYIGLNFSFRSVGDPSRLTHIPNFRIDPGGYARDDASGEEGNTSGPGRYVAHQVDALRIFLARIIGIGTRRRLDEAIQKTIQQHSWVTQCEDGSLQFDADHASSETYNAVLAAAVEFAIDIAGKRWALRELAASEGSLDEKDVSEAEELGLREFIHGQ